MPTSAPASVFGTTWLSSERRLSLLHTQSHNTVFKLGPSKALHLSSSTLKYHQWQQITQDSVEPCSWLERLISMQADLLTVTQIN